MKKPICLIVALLCLSLSFAARTARADMIGRMRIDIPFDFVVANQMLKAGTYWCRSMGANGHLYFIIQSEDYRTTATVFANRLEAKTTPSAPQMVFNRYGDEYFLAQIWSGQDERGGEVLKSKRERELLKDPARNLAARPSDRKVHGIEVR
jgi:hypothetical protein